MLKLSIHSIVYGSESSVVIPKNDPMASAEVSQSNLFESHTVSLRTKILSRKTMHSELFAS